MDTNVVDEKRNDAALERYIYFFNNLHIELDRADEYVSEDSLFQDPFNRVEGIPQLTTVLQKFVSSVRSPNFHVTHKAWSGNVCFIRWDFSGHLSLFGEWRFPGVSELHFDTHGHVRKHIDHWDSGEHFYQRLPVLGRIVQMIRRRV